MGRAHQPWAFHQRVHVVADLLVQCVELLVPDSNTRCENIKNSIFKLTVTVRVRVKEKQRPQLCSSVVELRDVCC